MFDVRVHSNCKISNDLVVVQTSGATKRDMGLGDTHLEDDFLSMSLGVFNASDGGGKGDKGVEQVSIGVWTEHVLHFGGGHFREFLKDGGNSPQEVSNSFCRRSLKLGQMILVGPFLS